MASLGKASLEAILNAAPERRAAVVAEQRRALLPQLDALFAQGSPLLAAFGGGRRSLPSALIQAVQHDLLPELHRLADSERCGILLQQTAAGGRATGDAANKASGAVNIRLVLEWLADVTGFPWTCLDIDLMGAPLLSLLLSRPRLAMPLGMPPSPAPAAAQLSLLC